MHENYRRRMMASRDPRFAKIATRMGYGTRDMVAERAEPVAPAKPTAEATAGDDEIVAMRAEYERVIGRKPFAGWDIETLRQRIARAKDTG